MTSRFRKTREALAAREQEIEIEIICGQDPNEADIGGKDRMEVGLLDHDDAAGFDRGSQAAQSPAATVTAMRPRIGQ